METEVKKVLDVAGVFKKSWEHYKRNWKVLTGVALIGGLVSFMLNSGADDSVNIYSLVSMVVGIVLQLIMINASLSAVRGTLKVNQLWTRTNRIVPLFLVSLLVGLLTLLGFVLLIIPGIILMVALQLAQYVTVDQKRGVIESLYASADLTRGVRWQLLGAMVVVVGMNILGALMFGVGLLVTVPLSSVVMAEVYERLTKTGLGHRVAVV